MEDGTYQDVVVCAATRCRKATTEISQPRSGWNKETKSNSSRRDDGNGVDNVGVGQFRRPCRTDLPMRPGFQPLCGWLISVGPAGP
jgi:hypothetical protein